MTLKLKLAMKFSTVYTNRDWDQNFLDMLSLDQKPEQCISGLKVFINILKKSSLDRISVSTSKPSWN